MKKINSVFEAWKYYRTIQGGFTAIDEFKSKAKHDGPEGTTHIISISNDGKTREYLSKKAYWWTGWARIANDTSLIPRSDFGVGGETLKTKMIERWRSDLERSFKIIHVIVLENSQTYVFDGSKILEYIDKYNTWIDDKFLGHNAAAGYPARLARIIEPVEIK